MLAFFMIAKIFFIFELLVLFGCGSILLLVETFDSIAILIERAQSIFELFPVIYLRIPNIIQEILPLSLVISAMLTVAKIYQHQEYLSFLLSGKSPFFMFLPIHLLSICFASAGFFFEEFVSVKTNNMLQNHLIETFHYYGQDFRYYSEPKMWFKNKETFYRIGQRNTEPLSFSNIVRFSLKKGNLQKYSFIDALKYENNTWNSYNTRSIHLYKDKKMLISSKDVRIDENQTFFNIETDVPTNLNIFELKELIQQRKHNGYSTLSYEALFLQKITFPFSGALLVFCIFSLIQFFHIRWNISYAIGLSAISIFLFGFIYNSLFMSASQGIISIIFCWMFFPFLIIFALLCEYRYQNRL